MESELISVIIPIYNSEQYLERCLHSVLASTYRNLEIICVNDGSTDGSAAILERLAQNDSRIRVITTENGGVSAARNKGLNAASGTFISFVDSDDQIHPRMLELMYRGISQHSCGLATCDYTRPNATLAACDLPSVDADNFDLLNAEQLYHIKNQKGYSCAKIYSVDLIGNTKFIEERELIEDVLFNAELFTKNLDLRVCYFKDPMYYYYDTPGSLSHSFSDNALFATAKTYSQIAARLESERARRIILREEIKILLARRNYIRMGSKRTELKNCTNMLKDAVGAYTKLSCVSKKEKLMYNTMLHVPMAYSLGTWLIMQKNKRR